MENNQANDQADAAPDVRVDSAGGATSKWRRLAELEQRAVDDAWDGLALAAGGGHGQNPGDCLTIDALADPCLMVVEALARRQGMKVAPLRGGGAPEPDCEKRLRRVLENSYIYYRKFRIEPAAAPAGCADFIAFKKSAAADSAPSGLVAVTVDGRGGMRVFDPADGRRRHIGAAELAEFAPFGYEIYPQLQMGRVSWRDLLRVAMEGVHRDLWLALWLGAAGGILSLAPPYATSLVFGSVIPRADHAQLIQVGIALVGAALAGTLFNLLSSLMILRVKTRSDYRSQAAVVGRLLKLPLPFFKKFSSGDLAQRVMGVGQIRGALADGATKAVFSLLFALPNFFLMFWFSPGLAAVAALVLTCQFLVIAAVSMLNYRNQSGMLEAQGELSGFVLQVVRGIAKIRHSISENRVFVKWAERFSRELKWRARVVGNTNFLAVFDAGYPPLATCVFFLLAGGVWRDSLPTGGYLAFTAAFTVVITAVMGCSNSLASLVAVVPLLRRLRPILDERPEAEADSKTMPPLDGRVEISRVSCRYGADTPLVLKDVSISAAPGEFVAIVGPSGAGKSTIVRLLLGFETPESGAILFGGQDIAEVNKRELRAQLGVVMQMGELTGGSIYENIAGAGSDLSLQDAWEAARLAGCAEDIERMPMGMHTLVGDGSVSGGQKQRLLIARALARQPKVVVFDEATSALDNETQARIAASLDNMRATRIVVAHRLSTIRNADRVYVLEAGRVAQIGTCEELINQPGVFRRLAERQLL